jgi:hypothetical protein
MVIRPNWTLFVQGAKNGFVVDRFVNRGKQKLERGDVVVIHRNADSAKYLATSRIPLIEVEVSSKAQDACVCGVVDEPTSSSAMSEDFNQDAIRGLSIGTMVTLGAYSQCKVDADIAPIVAGDLLTTSASPGYAQKLPATGQRRIGVVIGKALASLANGKGMIPVLISHQ